MKRFISFSGGVESTTMCILYGKDAKAIWCDTGAEHDEMYERIDYCESVIKKLHPSFEVIRIKAKYMVLGNEVDSLVDAVKIKKYMPSMQRRWCTGRFKIEPIDKFLSGQGDCELMIGLNADELKREGNYGLQANVRYLYPLQEDGLNREDCIDILNEYELNPDFPLFMSRGGCYMCIFKTVAEYKAMYLFDRKTFNKVMDLEESIQDKRGKFFTVSVSCKSMRWISNQVESELKNWGEENVKSFYSKIEQKQACGAFCHR